MTKIFTQDDIVRFIYKETTPDENKEIELALFQDNDLYNFYREIGSLSSKLNKLNLSPSERSIRNILNYSSSYSALTEHTVKV